MFPASRDLGLESFLHASVKKTITNHVLIKTGLHERGLANVKCQCKWLKVTGVGGGGICNLCLRDQLEDSHSLSLRNLPHL